jgi:hypothetical protein
MPKWSVSAIAIVIVACALPLASCGTATFTSAPLERVFEGRELPKPIDMGKLKSSIQLALIDLNWRTISQTEDSVSAEFRKDEGEVRATIKVAFSTSGYQIQYVDSRGLNVDLEEKTIHRNYMRWVRNLDKEIATNYVK